jgi:hypothetical protein
MRNAKRLLLIAGFGSALAVTTAHSQTNPIYSAVWSLYETGTSLFQGLAPSVPGGGSNVYSINIVGYVNGAPKLDPISGLTTLYYNWALATLPGDVLLLEPQTSHPSDLLRFDGLGGVYFFSDIEPGETDTDLADVPQLPLAINPIVLSEIGAEGLNHAFYTPMQGQPGFDVSGILPGVSYDIISDVPEPNAALFLLSGLAICSLNRFRRLRRP